VSPTEEIRDLAKSIIGERNFIEVFLNPPAEVCETRDVKGMYRKAREGQITDFTGVNAPFEIPVNPDLVIDTGSMSVDESISEILRFIMPAIEYRGLEVEIG
jgi:adenylylsulfate kinase